MLAPCFILDQDGTQGSRQNACIAKWRCTKTAHLRVASFLFSLGPLVVFGDPLPINRFMMVYPLLPLFPQAFRPYYYRPVYGPHILLRA